MSLLEGDDLIKELSLWNEKNHIYSSPINFWSTFGTSMWGRPQTPLSVFDVGYAHVEGDPKPP